MVEHVAAPDVVERVVVEGKQLERRLCNIDALAELFVRDSFPCALDVKRNRIDGDNATAESPYELDRVHSVARSDIEDNMVGSDA